jgi:outer membrane protein assembly factor BamB
MRRWLLTIWAGVILASASAAEDWTQFRGPRRDNIARATGLLRQWPPEGPPVRWSLDVCQGYAGAAIHGDRVYFNDYSQEDNEWYVRCVTLAEGREVWRYRTSQRIRPNHGITRAVPAVDEKYVFSLDPKCIFYCLDAQTGHELWRKSFVHDYGAQIPPWYNGQCPLIEPDRVILAPGGDALMVALRKDTGDEIWRTPNPEKWPLSHSSIMPAELAGVQQYLWCTLFGPLGVAADDGRLLWFHPRKFNVAVAPSPLPIDGERVFMTAGYDAGSIMLRVSRTGDQFTTETVFDLGGDEWNSEVHTPILYQDHMFAVGKKRRGLFTCLDLSGREVWTSQNHASFELGSFLLADDLFFILEGKTGVLRLLEANTSEYRELASAKLLPGHDAWAPMALSNGKLVLRDMTRMICIDVAAAPTAEASAAPATRVAGVSFLAPPDRREDQPPDRPATPPYRLVRTIADQGPGPTQFAEALRGIAVDPAGRIHAVGDSAVKVFSPAGELLHSWSTARPGHCIAVAPDGTIYVGQAEQVERFDARGNLRDTWSDPERLRLITAIGFAGNEVLLADARARCVHRYNHSGEFQGDIGRPARGRGIQLPNGVLDLAVDRENVIHLTNSGRHRIERYTTAGELLGHIGRFDGRDPAGFTGCCNPTNLAITSTGTIAVTVKAPPGVKLYDTAGHLLTIIGPDNFDPACKNMSIATDNQGHLYVVDTVRLHICVFAPEPAVLGPPAGDTPTNEGVEP